MFLPKKTYPFNLLIETDSLRVLQTSKKNGLLKIIGAAETKIPSSFLEKGTIISPEGLNEVLRNLLKKSLPSSIDSDRCLVSLPDDLVFFKRINLPKIKYSEIEEAVLFSAKDSLPLPAEQLYFDWQEIESKDGFECALVAVSKKLIDSYIDSLKLLGIAITCFEPCSFSLARLVGLKNKKTCLVAYFAFQKITFVFVKNGIVLFVTTQGLQEGNEFSFLKQEIIKAVNFWRQDKKDKEEIEQIFLAGEIKDLSMVCLEVKRALGVKVLPLPLPVELPVGINESTARHWAPLFGLSLYPKTKGKTLNLLPEWEEKQQIRHLLKVKILALLKFFSIFLLFLMATFSFAFLKLYFEEKKTEHSLTSLSKLKTSPRQKAQEEKIISLNKKLNILENNFPLKKNFSSFLADFADRLPVGIKVESLDLSWEKKTLKLKVVTASRADILILEEVLRQIGEVKIPLSSLEKPKMADFEVVITNLK